MSFIYLYTACCTSTCLPVLVGVGGGQGEKNPTELWFCSPPYYILFYRSIPEIGGGCYPLLTCCDALAWWMLHVLLCFVYLSFCAPA